MSLYLSDVVFLEYCKAVLKKKNYSYIKWLVYWDVEQLKF